MRVNGGVAKKGIQFILKLLRDHMLQFVGLVMHLIPTVAQLTGQESSSRHGGE